MKRTLAVVGAGLLALTLGGCLSGEDGAPPSVKDPREGRVTITWSNCATGNCIYDWKICIGPDLEIHLNDRVRTIRNSEECKV